MTSWWASLAIFNHVGGLMILRWLHMVFGIIWIGALFYFYFVQKSFSEELKNQEKLAALEDEQKRVFYFATASVLSGAAALLASSSMSFYSSWGICILLGSMLGALMWLNLCLIIRPQQKLALNTFMQMAHAQTPPPGLEKNLLRMEQMSRTNLILALPMLFFMGASSHLGIEVNAHSNAWLLWSLLLGIVAIVEINALNKKGLQIINNRRAVLGGIFLWSALYLILEFFTK